MNHFEDKRYLPSTRALLYRPKSLIDLLKRELPVGNNYSNKITRTFFILRIHQFEIQFINIITLS